MNIRGVEIFVEGQLACGLKLTFDSSSHGGQGQVARERVAAKGWDDKIRTGHKREYISLDVDFYMAGPSVWHVQVLGQEDWLAG